MATGFGYYLAGVGTVVIALTAGFGGGILLTDRFTSTSAVPEKSRIARVMEDQKPAAVPQETMGTASVIEEQSKPEPKLTSVPEVSISPIEIPEAPTPVTPRSATERAPVVAAPAVTPLTSVPMRAVAKPQPPAQRSIELAPSRPNPELIVEKPLKKEPRREAKNKRKKEKDSVKIRVKKDNENTRYIVRTADGRAPSGQEVEELKERLRMRRNRSPDQPALSYQPQGRTIFGLFGN